MKQKIAAQLIFLSLISLPFKGQVAVLSYGGLSQAAPSRHQISISPAPQVVRVVALPDAPRIAVAAAVSQTVSCKNSMAVASPSLIQNAGGINLNEPAACFSLNFAYIPAPLPRINVVELPRNNAVIAVLNQPAQITAVNLSPSSGGQSLPVLPAALFVIGVLFYEDRKKIAAKITNYVKASVPGLPGTKVFPLRC